MPSAELPPVAAAAEYSVLSRRSDALARRQRWTAFGLLAVTSLAVATAFAWTGAWLVLPYSVLELALVAAAFVVVERRARDWERLTVAGDRVIVEQALRGRRVRREFNRWWLRVELQEVRPGAAPLLRLRFAGEALEFGEALAPGRRRAVAMELRRLVASR
jgi:uncharacterized membrane protein